MPINLHTGLPGSGKTLFTIHHVKALAEKTGRPVYHNGIADLSLDWHKIDGDKWHEQVPDGALVVFDEGQRDFRPRGNGQSVPPHVEALETHRHRGIDIYITTQHPMMLDTNVRRLTDTHRHLLRIFGTPSARVHLFNGCRPNPDQNRKDSQETTFVYPSDVFQLYKSAELHTIKAKIPKRLLMFIALPIVLGVAVWAVLNWAHTSGAAPSSTAGKAKPSDTATLKPTAAQGMPYTVESFKPRIDNLPESAPRYDGITRPVRAPKIAGTFVFKGHCHLIQADGTAYPSTEEFCRQVLANGVPHYDWDNPEDRQQQERKPDPQQPDTAEKPQEPSQGPIKFVDMPSKPTPMQQASEYFAARE